MIFMINPAGPGVLGTMPDFCAMTHGSEQRRHQGPRETQIEVGLEQRGGGCRRTRPTRVPPSLAEAATPWRHCQRARNNKQVSCLVCTPGNTGLFRLMATPPRRKWHQVGAVQHPQWRMSTTTGGVPVRFCRKGGAVQRAQRCDADHRERMIRSVLFVRPAGLMYRRA